ncbi:twin-arginine translocation signal domain-containing protein [Halorussus salinisoli]|uniref:twin-arginine translocation signal domain-containing protein n=1 Tax=Halorussus salinisoli TaxID=2558242 RepID=UPI0010C18A10|nr:twin-arginine translocation signal domain-containing protein [Halorussus salinisoli]
MTDSADDRESNIDRRTVLKGTAAAGFAASGLAGTASADGFDEITFCAVGEEVFSYVVSVTGKVERGGTYESDSGDEILDENSARGAVSDGRCDSWLFTGEPTELKLDGPGKVFVNGELFEDTTEDDEKRLPNTITVEGEGPKTEYKFRVSGRVEAADNVESSDRISDSNTVRGVVNGGFDVYRYSGAIAFDEPDGSLTVTLDFDSD